MMEEYCDKKIIIFANRLNTRFLKVSGRADGYLFSELIDVCVTSDIQKIIDDYRKKLIGISRRDFFFRAGKIYKKRKLKKIVEYKDLRAFYIILRPGEKVETDKIINYIEIKFFYNTPEELKDDYTGRWKRGVEKCEELDLMKYFVEWEKPK